MILNNILQTNININSEQFNTDDSLINEALITGFKDIFEEVSLDVGGLTQNGLDVNNNTTGKDIGVESAEKEISFNRNMAKRGDEELAFIEESFDVSDYNESEELSGFENLPIKDSFDENAKIRTKKINGVKCSLSGADEFVTNLTPDNSNITNVKIDEPLELDINSVSEKNTVTTNISDETRKNNAYEIEGDGFLLKHESPIAEEDFYVTEDVTQTSQEYAATEKSVLTQIKEGLNNTSASRSIQVMLKPNTLGKVNMSFKFYNNALHINVFVENSLTEEILQQNIAQVVKMLDPSSLIEIESVTVKKFSDLHSERGIEENDLKSVEKKKLIKDVQYIKGIYKI